jgi:hypothetical protein
MMIESLDGVNSFIMQSPYYIIHYAVAHLEMPFTID